MDKIELCKVSSLKDHPKNKDIFGDVRGDSDLLDKIKKSIVEMGLQEPIIIKQDGTILSGHIRLAAFQDLLEVEVESLSGLCDETRNLLKKKVVPVRVHEDFESAGAEVDYLILSNILRRQLEPSARNAMFRLLRQRDIEDPLTLKGGRPKKGEGRLDSTQRPKSRVAQLAEATGTTVRHLNREDEVLGHPLVDDEIRQLIDEKVYTVTQVFDALNLMIDDMAREGKSPTTPHLLIALQNPQEKPFTPNFGDAVRKAAGLDPAPKPEPIDEPEVEEPEVEEPEPPPAPKPKPKPAPKVKPEPTVPEVREAPKPEEPKVEVRRAEDTYISVGEKIALARKSFEKLLGEADLSELTKTELLGLHKRLSSFLETLGLISQPKPTPGLPARLEDQLALFTEVVEDVGEVEDPMAVRDLLLSLSMKAKTSANRLTQAPKTFKPNGLFCPECFSPQVTTPSGDVCENGHGGVYGITQAKMVQAKAAREEPPAAPKVEAPKPKIEAAPPPKDEAPKVDDPDDFSGLLEGMTFESADDASIPSVPPPAPTPKVEPQAKTKALPDPKFGASDLGIDPDDLATL